MTNVMKSGIEVMKERRDITIAKPMVGGILEKSERAYKLNMVCKIYNTY